MQVNNNEVFSIDHDGKVVDDKGVTYSLRLDKQTNQLKNRLLEYAKHYNFFYGGKP